MVLCAAQAFKFPFIEPYLRFFGDDAYKRGVNFAISTGTATITYSLPGTGFFLQRETNDYFDFIANHTGQTIMLVLAPYYIQATCKSYRLCIEHRFIGEFSSLKVNYPPSRTESSTMVCHCMCRSVASLTFRTTHHTRNWWKRLLFCLHELWPDT